MYCLYKNKKIYYRKIGKGEPLIVIHGGLGLDHEYLYYWFAPLSESLSLYFLDLPGNGKSYWNIRESIFSIQFLVNAIEELRTSEGIKRVNLLGHSYGGFVALAYSLLFPNNINKLVLVDAVALANYSDNSACRKLISKLGKKDKNILTKKIKTNSDFKEYADALFPIYFRNNKSLREFKIHNRSKFFLSTYLKGLKALKNAKKYINNFKRIQTQTLLLHGKFDCVVARKNFDFIKKSIHHCSSYIFKKSGHFPFVEEQSLFLRMVKKFLHSA